MTQRRSAVTLTLAGLTVLGAALTGVGLAGMGSAVADPADPAPVTIVPAPPPAPVAGGQASAMTPNQAAVPAGEPGAAPSSPFQPYVPEIQNQTYGSGQYGGGILGTIKDLWHQAQNPMLGSEGLMGSDGSRPTPPPGAGPAPALPPGYVSTNAPGSETASTSNAGAGSGPRPALPPGYYSIDGPPPPGYQFSNGQPTTPAAAPTPVVITAYPRP